MAEAEWELQKALYSALTGDAGVQAVIGQRVYDHVPGNPTFPYATIGDVTATDTSTFSKDGHEHLVDVHVWSRYRGRKEVKQFIGAAHSLLHKGALTINAHVHAGTMFDSSRTLRDPDGLTYHGIITLRITTFEL